MSGVYNRSRKESLRRYFSQASTIEKGLGCYSIETNRFTSSRRFGVSANGGVPLSFNEETKDVFVDDADSHSFIVGATGSKKSRLIAMPTIKILESAKESMIISDPKAEIYKHTANSLRRSGYDVFVINLREPECGNAWNPLTRPYDFYCSGKTDLAYEFANDITVNLSGDHPQHDPFWTQSAASFFFGLIMLLFEIGRKNGVESKYINIENIIKLREIICEGLNNDDDEPFPPLSNSIRQFAKRNDFIYTLLRGTLNTANVTRRGILSHFDQNMRTFSIQPRLLEMLSNDDEMLSSLRERPTAIFLVVPDEKTGFHRLVSLYIKQSYEYLIFKAQQREARNERVGLRVNYILDEFSSLPAIQDFPAMITAARSRDIRFNLFVQGKHQLDLRYKDEAYTIRSNCNNWIYLVSRELPLLEELSSLCGVMSDASERLVPVLSVADLQQLDKEKGETLILSGRNKPYIARLPDISSYNNFDEKMAEFEKQPHAQNKIDFKCLSYSDDEKVIKVRTKDSAGAKDYTGTEELLIKPSVSQKVTKKSDTDLELDDATRMLDELKIAHQKIFTEMRVNPKDSDNEGNDWDDDDN